VRHARGFDVARVDNGVEAGAGKTVVGMAHGLKKTVIPPQPRQQAAP
jgi:hypothetical protein